MQPDATTVYYAHCMAIYHTPQENRDVEMLENLGFAVVTPNTFAIAEQCRAIQKSGVADPSGVIMRKIFKPLVRSCGALAFRALPDGSIPAGVAREISWAAKFGLPVFELPCAIGRRTLSIDHTREYLSEIGQR